MNVIMHQDIFLRARAARYTLRCRMQRSRVSRRTLILSFFATLIAFQYASSTVSRIRQQSASEVLDAAVVSNASARTALREVRNTKGAVLCEANKSDADKIAVVFYKNGVRLDQDSIPDLAVCVADWSQQADLEPEEVLAVIRTESNFVPWATSNAGAVGLMQMLPYVAQSMADKLHTGWVLHAFTPPTLLSGLPGPGHHSLVDPWINLRLGIHYLGSLRKRFQNPELYLAAYNMGPTLLESKMQRGFWPRGSYSGKVRESQLEIRAIIDADLKKRSRWRRPAAEATRSIVHDIHHLSLPLL